MALKKLSARALSQHCPVRPCDRMTPWSSARVAYSAEVYWQPRSAWKMTPDAGSRAARALARAPAASSVRLGDPSAP